MSREVCGICWCPYDEDTGACACAPQSPPQRKPLTEEELKDIYTNTKGMDFYLHFARAIERAHGIGGEA